MDPPTWYPSKHEMPVLPHDCTVLPYSRRFVLSRDKPRARRAGAKEYAVFDTPEEACAFVEKRRGGSYYEVLEHKNSPCHLYFDLDRHDTTYPYATIKRQFTCAFEVFVAETQGTHFNIRSGENAQFSSGTREGKTSMHVKLDIVAPSVVHVQNLTNLFNTWLTQRKQEYYSLTVNNTDETVLDTNVHSNFQNFRMLHMTKAHDERTRLVPDAVSSDLCIAHTIGCYGPPAGAQIQLKWLDKSEMYQQRSDPAGLASAAARTATGQAPTFAKEAEYINAWDGIRTHFPTPVQVVRVDVNFPIHRYKLAHETVCPYAGRAHQRNNVYIQHDTCSHRAEVQCYDEECKGKQTDKTSTITMDLDSSEMVKLHDEAYGHIDLHTQQDNIVWDEEYTMSTMRELPVKKLVCVRAGMGIGKTIAIKAMLEKECDEDTKVLCVTFSRTLAGKLYKDFAPLGFKNYQEQKGDLNFSKVVVCLDSLHRVTTSNFHFVILDEAVSVFLHFNSKLMKNSSINSWKLELFIRQCQRATYFVDAALDTTFMMNIVAYFSKAISCKAHWIRNKHIRESKRHAIVTTCETDENCVVEESLVTSAIMKVRALLQRGDKVVVCSSTKSFTETLGSFVAKAMPDKRVMVYNSTRATKSEHGGGGALDNVNDKWVHYDLLVYSPSVSAGVSFTVHHYDSLVAYLVNSRFTPSVDLSLQQLFRVRNLTKGEMHIHVHNKRPHVRLPHTVKDIERCELNPTLGISSSPMYYEAQMMINPRTNALTFDRDRLSYQVLLGIKLMHNKSAMFYTDLLCSTLKEDYDIGITRKNVEMLKGDQYDMDIATLKEVKTAKAGIPFASVQVLDKEEYDALQDAETELTEEDRAAMKLYTYRQNIYGVSIDRTDEDFYKTYVEGALAYDTYCRNRRFRLLSANDLSKNKQIYANKMSALISREDYNLDLHKKLMATHHRLLLTSQTFLTMLLTEAERAQLKAHKEVVVQESHVKETLVEFLDRIKTGRYTMAQEHDFYQMYQITNKSATLTVLKNIVKRGLGLEVNRGGATNAKRAAYKYLHIQSRYDEFEQRYSPTYPTDAM